ncbi:camphor resistance protein CrcB [Methanofervidicoccus sp. A16]|uniref:fluoride efflux transporter CrcB n=1 Tax=Methanofervidicoccus sp. A16 TaxID=2607662 RepID=UPI00118B7AB8|nr:fluoride efflux transporter CrcB [Methanofervidicoccus sp. A16]AXI25071.1 camphor resistance protein CrcB [Methanofervidicoccus sp. A16]
MLELSQNLKEILLIGLGGFLGAVTRYILSNTIPVVFEMPLGTFGVNLIGSFIMGFFMYSPLNEIYPQYRFLIVTGFCGALSTFSTFSYENLFLLEKGFIIKVVLNILLNVVGCILAVYLGKSLSISLFGEV